MYIIYIKTKNKKNKKSIPTEGQQLHRKVVC